MSEKIIASLLGAIVGGLISFLTAKLFLKKSMRVQANDKFRAIFVDELYMLEKEKSDVYRILNGVTFEKHERARIEFEIFLYKGEVSKFIETWSVYSKYVQWCWGQKIAPGSKDVRKIECEKATQHIRKLLEFTKTA